jgi:hypothetical protein
MLCSYNLCPVCGKNLIHYKRLNKKHDLSDSKLSYVESICNYGGDDPNTTHIFRQLTSLYGELLGEQLNIPLHYFEIKNNYIKSNTEVKLFKKTDAIDGTPDNITFKKVIKINYHNMDKIINRIRTMNVFL